MPYKARLVGPKYVEDRLRATVARYHPELLVGVTDKQWHSMAMNLIRRPKFPRPFYSTKERRELHRKGLDYEQVHVDMFMRVFIAPQVKAGVLRLRPGGRMPKE